MQVTILDSIKLVSVQDFDKTAWLAKPPAVPDDYLVEFTSYANEADIQEVLPGRALYRDIRQVTASAPTGNGGTISIPSQTVVQRLLKKTTATE